MQQASDVERIDTVVIGGGQAGLAAGYYLSRREIPFVILDASERTGDTWRRRWDSLRLFSPARYSALPGLRFPAPPHSFPTKDEMGDYLESYASHFALPVRNGVRVERLSRDGDQFVLDTTAGPYQATNIIVAMGTFQRPYVPPFADDLDPGIVQLHSSEYRNPSQLRAGGVLIVGAGNSGADIAMELAPRHDIWMSGRDTGHVPFRIETRRARLLIPLVARFLFHRVLTVRTPVGRRIRPRILAHGGPLIRVKPKDLRAAGVERVPRTADVQGGLPVLEDGRVLDVANVIWCTGFHHGFDWIDLPVHGEHEPTHERGIVPGEPGLYFVGLEFLYSLSSEMIHGVERDAARVVDHITERHGRTGRRDEVVAATAAGG